MIEPIHAIQTLLRTPKKISIIIHQSPDGDALGSGIALTTFLEKQGHHVTLISPDTPPPFLQWLPHIQRILSFDQEKDKTQATHAIHQSDIILCIDFPTLHRAGDIAPLIKASQAPKIVLDHHPDHETFADHTWIDTTAAATAILVYRMIHTLANDKSIDKTIATCLYVGILTDTGSFQYTNTNAESHLAAATLIQKGADLPTIRQHLSTRQPLHKAQFFGYMISKRLVVMPQYQTAYFLLPRTDYIRFKLQPGDTAGLASQGLEIEGISLAVLLVEKDDKIHLSFRSIDPIPVNHLSQQYFSGGGHRHAAGGCSFTSLQETEQKLRQVITTEIPQYLSTQTS